MRLLQIVKSRRARTGASWGGRNGLATMLVAALVCLAGPVLAQTAPSKSTAPGSYRIGEGDLLQVEVSGRSDLSGQYTVGLDGTFVIPVIGSVKATGRTTDEIATDLSRRISLVQREIPQVTVSVLEYRSRKIFVLGSVLLPGSYSFAENPSVWDAIAEAGGPTEDADLTAVEVIPGDLSGDRQTFKVDVAGAIKAGKLDTLDKLRPGDTVRVPRVGAGGSTAAGGATPSDVFYIFGAVTAQGSHPMTDVPDLATAVIRSAPTPDANLKKVQVVRRSGARVMQMTVNLSDYLGQARLSGNPPLLSGDTVYVPRSGKGPGVLAAIGWISTVVGLTTSIAILARGH